MRRMRFDSSARVCAGLENMKGNRMLDERIIESCKSHIRNLRGFDRSEFVSVEKGRFEMRANEYDNVHGGFLLALADEAASGAADTYGYDNATMTVSANFLRPARITDEYLSVVAVVRHAGKRTVVAEVSIARPNGEVVFKSTYTMAVFETRIAK